MLPFRFSPRGLAGLAGTFLAVTAVAVGASPSLASPSAHPPAHSSAHSSAHPSTQVRPAVEGAARPLSFAAPAARGATITNFGDPLAAASPLPEGIAADPSTREIFASSLGLIPTGSGFRQASTANVAVLSAAGRLIRRLPVSAGPGGVVALAGELLVPGSGLYVCDMSDGLFGAKGHGRLLRLDPDTGAVTVVLDGLDAPNALALDGKRRLYVADAASGKILRTDLEGRHVITWLQDAARLGPANGAPLGANGLAFDAGRRHLYITNPGTRQVLRASTTPAGDAGRLSVFADGPSLDIRQDTQESLVGADGIQVDSAGNIWVAADWVNELQVLSPRGRITARYRGSQNDALHNPASLVFLGKTLYISNLDGFSAAPGANSKISTLGTSRPGLPLTPTVTPRR